VAGGWFSSREKLPHYIMRDARRFLINYFSRAPRRLKPRCKNMSADSISLATPYESKLLNKFQAPWFHRSMHVLICMIFENFGKDSYVRHHGTSQESSLSQTLQSKGRSVRETSDKGLSTPNTQWFWSRSKVDQERSVCLDRTHCGSRWCLTPEVLGVYKGLAGHIMI